LRPPLPPRFPLFPYTTLFRSNSVVARDLSGLQPARPTVAAGSASRPSQASSAARGSAAGGSAAGDLPATGADGGRALAGAAALADRKSTRLNSIHGSISYAVF